MFQLRNSWKCLCHYKLFFLWKHLIFISYQSPKEFKKQKFHKINYHNQTHTCRYNLILLLKTFFTSFVLILYWGSDLSFFLSTSANFRIKSFQFGLYAFLIEKCVLSNSLILLTAECCLPVISSMPAEDAQLLKGSLTQFWRWLQREIVNGWMRQTMNEWTIFFPM